MSGRKPLRRMSSALGIWRRGSSLGAGGVLDAVVGPEVLGAVGDLDGVEGVLAGVGAGEGDVAEGVPVLGEDDVGEAGGDGVDSGEDGVAVGDGEGTAGEEVALHVDDQKHVCGGEPKSHYLIVRRGDGFGDSPPIGWARESCEPIRESCRTAGRVGGADAGRGGVWVDAGTFRDGGRSGAGERSC